jgi:hypothetical protein
VNVVLENAVVTGGDGGLCNGNGEADEVRNWNNMIYGIYVPLLKERTEKNIAQPLDSVSVASVTERAY